MRQGLSSIVAGGDAIAPAGQEDRQIFAPAGERISQQNALLPPVAAARRSDAGATRQMQDLSHAGALQLLSAASIGASSLGALKCSMPWRMSDMMKATRRPTPPEALGNCAVQALIFTLVAHSTPPIEVW
jgi:hypothetical protein